MGIQTIRDAIMLKSLYIFVHQAATARVWASAQPDAWVHAEDVVVIAVAHVHLNVRIHVSAAA